VDGAVTLRGEREVYVRYRIQDLALDQFRLSEVTAASGASGLEVSHVWSEDGLRKTRSVPVGAGARSARYAIEVPSSATVTNEA
jgi:hypothetical protein